MAPHGTDTRESIRESFVQSEPSPALDRQLNANHNCPLDTCTHSGAHGNRVRTELERMCVAGQGKDKRAWRTPVRLTDLLEMPGSPGATRTPARGSAAAALLVSYLGSPMR